MATRVARDAIRYDFNYDFEDCHPVYQAQGLDQVLANRSERFTGGVARSPIAGGIRRLEYLPHLLTSRGYSQYWRLTTYRRPAWLNSGKSVSRALMRFPPTSPLTLHIA